MLAQLSAFDVLVGVLVIGFISALFGWAGGAGARLVFSLRLDKVEAVTMTILNRSKGAIGGERAQQHRNRVTSAEKEAEELAKRLAAQAPRRGRFGRPLPPVDQAELESLQEIEAAQQKARAAAAGA